MGKLFGTDGVRGVANRELTPELAFRLGRAGAYVLSQSAPHPRIVIGKDTRISGDMLEAALIAGITSVGGEALPVGVLPTPGIAFLTRELQATAGVVISASHNPVQDNGIKFFAGTGYKLPDALEEEIESYVLGQGSVNKSSQQLGGSRAGTDGKVDGGTDGGADGSDNACDDATANANDIDDVDESKATPVMADRAVDDAVNDTVGDQEGLHHDGLPAPTGIQVGRVIPVADAAERYIAFLRKTVPGDFAGMKIVIDGANGAASKVGPELFRSLGAEVITIHCAPDGTNINAGCGSTHPESLAEAVVANGADLGLAFDGDADRLIVVDEKGAIVDGDQIMVAIALYMKEQGQLPKDTVAVTVMSNMGLHLALKAAGIQILETKVGDRYVLEALRENGAVFGGEQSGHILMLNHNTTGDGVLSALQLVRVLREKGQKMSELAGQMQKLPQLLVNVRVKDKACQEELEVKAAVAAGAAKLAGRGRILVRPSGTEPLIRVMGEGPDAEELRAIVEEIADVFRRYA